MPFPLEFIPDYDPIIKELLIQQFKGKEFEQIFTEAMNAQFEEIEEVCEQLLDERWLDTAEGAQLDILGEILNLPRGGRDDASYRTLLNLKAKVFSSFGQPEILIEAVKILYEATDVQYTPNYPAAVDILHDGSGGLFITDEMILDDLTNLILDDGGNMLLLSADTISADLLNTVIPAGVSVSVSTFP